MLSEVGRMADLFRIERVRNYLVGFIIVVGRENFAKVFISSNEAINIFGNEFKMSTSFNPVVPIYLVGRSNIEKFLNMLGATNAVVQVIYDYDIVRVSKIGKLIELWVPGFEPSINK